LLLKLKLKNKNENNKKMIKILANITGRVGVKGEIS
jgi:hypothetical protein